MIISETFFNYIYLKKSQLKSLSMALPHIKIVTGVGRGGGADELAY
jgi:hypothetical protein